MAIHFKNVNFSYNNKYPYVLKNINLKINEKNEMIALVGKIGSGKSTLVQLMNGLLLPSNGYIEIFNQKINTKTVPKNLISLRRKIGLVFQFPEYQLFETTVLKDVMFAPKNFGKNFLESEKKAIKALEQMHISSSLFDLSPFELSGGQQRKVAIAGILVMDPSILILDEPTRGLDIQNKIEIMNILKKKNEQDHKTIIFITHDMDLVSEYADKVIFLNQGQIMFFVSKNSFFMNNNLLNLLGSDEPQTFQILKFLTKKIGIPFEPKYSFQELLTYLQKFYNRNEDLDHGCE